MRNVKNLDAIKVSDAMIDDMMKLKGRALPSYLKPYTKNFKSDAKVGTAGFNKRQF